MERTSVPLIQPTSSDDAAKAAFVREYWAKLQSGERRKRTGTILDLAPQYSVNRIVDSHPDVAQE